MATARTTEWEGGGTYLEGKCDIPTCKKKPNWRNWVKDPLGFNGDDECIASLCNDHKEYKQFNTTIEIIKAFNLKNQLINKEMSKSQGETNNSREWEKEWDKLIEEYSQKSDGLGAGHEMLIPYEVKLKSFIASLLEQQKKEKDMIIEYTVAMELDFYKKELGDEIMKVIMKYKKEVDPRITHLKSIIAHLIY